MLVCLTCGQEILNNYLVVDGVGPYCMDCRKHRQPCYACGAPLSDKYWQLSDGRCICERCNVSAVYTPEETAQIYKAINQIADNILGIHLNIPTGIALVDQNQLANIIYQQDGDDEIYDVKLTLGIYARRGVKRAIYIQCGLPRNLLLQVAAHEFAHAWQGENCPLLTDSIIREGFAEWIAYRVIGYFNLFDQQNRLKERTDIYGRGLRWALGLESLRGPAGVVAYCRKAV